MTDRKVSTSGTSGIGDGIEGVELSLGAVGLVALLALPDAHLAWALRDGVAMLGRNRTPIADCMRSDFIFGLHHWLELSVVKTAG